MEGMPDTINLDFKPLRVDENIPRTETGVLTSNVFNKSVINFEKMDNDLP